jgi:hypothetical protein
MRSIQIPPGLTVIASLVLVPPSSHLDQVLTAAAAGVAGAIAVALTRWGGRLLLRLGRGLVQLGREVGEFREWRRSGPGRDRGVQPDPGRTPEPQSKRPPPAAADSEY